MAQERGLLPAEGRGLHEDRDVRRRGRGQGEREQQRERENGGATHGGGKDGRGGGGIGMGGVGWEEIEGGWRSVGKNGIYVAVCEREMLFRSRLLREGRATLHREDTNSMHPNGAAGRD